MKTLSSGVLLAVGAAAGVFASLLLQPLFQARPAQAQTARPSQEVGRFALVVTPAEANTPRTWHVLDTKTGQVYTNQYGPTATGKDSYQWTTLGSPVTGSK